MLLRSLETYPKRCRCLNGGRCGQSWHSSSMLGCTSCGVVDDVELVWFSLRCGSGDGSSTAASVKAANWMLGHPFALDVFPATVLFSMLQVASRTGSSWAGYSGGPLPEPIAPAPENAGYGLPRSITASSIHDCGRGQR